jgi:enterochelin esterase-like enzyme
LDKNLYKINAEKGGDYMAKRTIKKELVTSRWLNETKEILIYLPPGHETLTDLPLLVLHDGPDYFNLGRIVTQATPLIEAGELTPFSMMAIPVNKERRTSEYSPIGERQSSHMSMVVEELLPLVRSRYPISPRKDDLVIGGSSLGGTVSLHLALQYPDVCSRVLSQSGAFLQQTIDEVMRQPSLSHLQIYQSIGLSEIAVPTHMGTLDLVARNREMKRHLLEKNAKVAYYEEEGDHTWGFWQRELPRALRLFFGQ